MTDLQLFKEVFLAAYNDEEVNKDGKTLESYDDIGAGDKEEFLNILEGNSSWNEKIRSVALRNHQFSIVEQFGGEGLGDQYYYIVKIQDRYFRISGFYSSDYGSELYWDDIVEVTPYEVTVTKYQQI